MRDSVGTKVFRILTLVFLSGFVLFPIWVMATSSMKPLADVQGTYSWFPKQFTLAPYVDIWKTVPLGQYFKNSLVICVTSTVLSLVIALLAAYAVSRWTFRGRGLFRIAILSTQMFPGILFLLPLYLIFVSLTTITGIQFVGSALGLTVTYFTFVLPLAIWLLVGYFESIPRELDEAARVDGASPMRILWTVLVPAIRPGLIAVGIFSFLTGWGEVLFASVFTTGSSQTLAIGLRLYSNQNDVYWNQVMAASLVVSFPVVAAFLFLQRYIVNGLTAGAVK